MNGQHNTENRRDSLSSPETGKDRENVTQNSRNPCSDLKVSQKCASFTCKIEKHRQHCSTPPLENINKQDRYTGTPSEHPDDICCSGISASMFPYIDIMKKLSDPDCSCNRSQKVSQYQSNNKQGDIHLF
jgi:hypothetical protein